MGQSIVLGEIKAEIPLQNENSSNHQILWQQYRERIESLSPESKVSRFCMEAGFMRVVDMGQYLVTRNASEFLLRSVACREYTLPRDDPASEAKGWIQGNTRIGPILEVTTSFQHFKFGIEVRIQSMKEDNSQSWVRISYGTVRYVNNYIKYDTQNFADPQEEEDVPTSSGVVAARSKAKAKPQPRESTGTTTILLSERVWIDIEPSKQDLESYNLSKKVINLLRHNQKLHREEDGDFNSTKSNSIYETNHLPIQNWSDDRWLACLAAGGGSKRRYQYCSDYLGSIIYLRALQGHSGGNLIDLTLQDHVLIEPGIFPYIYHVGSNFNLKSIISNGLIPGGQDLSKRQSVFFLLVDPRDEDHKDPENIDYSVPRHARYLQNTWKRHQDTVFWIEPSQSDYTKEDYGRSWSSQEWKSGAAEHDRSGKPEEISWDALQKVDPHREEYLPGRNAHNARYGELIHDRTGKPVSVHYQEQAYFENFVMGSDAPEFMGKVKDQVRNRQKRMSSIAESCDEHSIIWKMFMATTLNAATFMGKNFSTIQSVVKNHESLTLKQMFDVTAQQSGRN